MIANLIALSVRARWAVIAAVAIVAGFGLWQLSRLPIDAVPDITNNQVQINTVDQGLSPVEMERRVTFPVETALAGIPGLQTTRSVSRNGFSQVTAVFRDGVDLYFARQQVTERLSQAAENLPEGVRPQIGPVTTGLGEVFMYAVDFTHPGGRGATVRNGQPGWQSDGSFLNAEGERLSDEVARGAYLRTVQDWIISPQLRSVAGVAGIDSIGGYEKQYLVEPDPVRLSSLGISITQLTTALEAANLSVGANFLERGGEAYLVRADARIRTVNDIADAVIATRNGQPVRVRDVATVRVGGELRTGAATMNGHEVVVGTALMLIGENSRTVARSVGRKLQTVERSLPPGISVRPTLDRSVLVNATIETVQRNLIEGAVLVAAALFLLLGNVRASLIAVLVIPGSFLMTAVGMNVLHVSGNLMSLGALDFGLIVDGAVIIIENCLARLARRQHAEGRLLGLRERLEETLQASQEMIRPTVYGQVIILLVFAPLLTFSGVEGRTFSPMAITLMLALASAFVLSLTFVPAMVAVLIRGRVAEKEVPLVGWIRRRYEPLLRLSQRRPWLFIGSGAAVFAVAAVTFTLLGQEFIPQLDERNLAIGSSRIPSTALEQSVRMQRGVEQAVTGLPEVALMFSKTGTAEVATDPMPQNISDGFVILRPQREWPAGVRTREDIVGRIEARLGQLVGNSYEVSQPIQLRFNELIAGVRGDVAIKIYGDDLEALAATGQRIARILQATPGAADVRVEQVSGAPTLDVQFDRAAIGRYGLTVEEVANTIATAMAGREAGLVFEGDRRFPVVVRIGNAARNDLAALRALPLLVPEQAGNAGASITLGQVAQFRFTDGLNQISRENGKRRVVVQANVRGRDVGSFVRQVRAQVEAVGLPTGSWIQWDGQFQNLQAAGARLALVVPLCFVAIFALLFLALGTLGRAISVFTAIPLALAGGVFTLALTSTNFSVSAAVGFICLSGVAVLNGVVVMSSIGDRLNAGMVLAHAITEGMLERVRPVIMTGIVPAIGFVPMALSHGTGAEVQKPLAMVVIGGLVTATALTLLVLPAISAVILGLEERWRTRRDRRLHQTAAIVPGE